MPIQDLSEYDMSPKRGYLCRHNASAVQLSGDFAVARDVAMRLPDFLPTNRVRHLLTKHLPDGGIAAQVEDLSDAEARMAMVHYSFMVQSYVWGESEAPTVLDRKSVV